jgi:hypothetical protein
MLCIALSLVVTIAAGPVNNLFYPLKPAIESAITQVMSAADSAEETWGGKR